MNSSIHINLNPNEFVRDRLDRLRVEFARACNWIVPIAKQNHCWNRVALHHLAYHSLRKTFPDLGSQMACNAIYAVCRSYRLLLKHPHSPYFGKKVTEGHLPTIYFLDQSPVFFDRHTLSLQKNVLSLFTLEGRLRFGISLSECDEQVFRAQKLREVQLSQVNGAYSLIMTLGEVSTQEMSEGATEIWPDYLVLKDQPGTMYGLEANPEPLDTSIRQVS